MFTAALFTIFKTWKQLKCLLMDGIKKDSTKMDGIKKENTVCVCVCLCVCVMVYYSATKKDENPAICENMDGSWGHYTKQNKSTKDKCCIITLTC